MKQLILLRHATRIDKVAGSDQNSTNSSNTEFDTSSWLLNYDPPLNIDLASMQIHALQFLDTLPADVVVHSSPYNRCIQTLELMMNERVARSHTELPSATLRVDQLLSEWLNYNFNLKFLPPNDNGISLLNNTNQYLYQAQVSTLHKDFTWDPNKLGRPGEYGESYADFKDRCCLYLKQLCKHYEDSDKTIVVVTHGAVISVLVQIIIGSSLFKEIPLCQPVIFTKLNQNLFQLHSSIAILSKFDQQIYNLRSLTPPVEYESNIFVDHDEVDSEYDEVKDSDKEDHAEDDDDDDSDDEGITFKVRSRSRTTGSIMYPLSDLLGYNSISINSNNKVNTTPVAPSMSESNFRQLKSRFFNFKPQDTSKSSEEEEENEEDDEMLLNFKTPASSSDTSPSDCKIQTQQPISHLHSQHPQQQSKLDLKKILFSTSSNDLYDINEEEDYWLGFNR